MGGGINNIGNMTINNCRINNNITNLNGGGIYNDGSLK